MNINPTIPGLRPMRGECPSCEAAQEDPCAPDCDRIDLYCEQGSGDPV